LGISEAVENHGVVVHDFDVVVVKYGSAAMITQLSDG
jgi:hypothetical protein